MNTKKIFILSCLCSFMVSLAIGQSKIVADKIIAVVGDKVILKSDLDNTITDMQRQGVEVPPNARCLSLEQAMGIKALVLQAEKDSLPVSEEEVAADIDNQIRYFIGAYGSKEKLEEISGKSLYQLKEDFKDGFKERKLAGDMRKKIVDGIHITPYEVKAYFDKIPKDSLPYYESELEIGQIVQYPKASREAEEYCIEQLNGFKQQVESGKREFKKLADIYSEDVATQKQNDGQLELNRSQKGFDPIFMGKAFALKEGQVSAPFKTPFGYHIVQMVSRAGDDATVRHILKIPQVTAAEVNIAKEKLDSVRAKLIAGTMQFGEAVAKYSDDEASKFTGGRRTNAEGSTYITIDQLDKDMVVMLQDLKAGQFSQPKEYEDERKKKGVRIVYLLSKTAPHRENIKDDYNKISLRALEEKKNNALEKWFNEKVGTYYIKIDDEYKSCEQMKKWINNTVVTGK